MHRRQVLLLLSLACFTSSGLKTQPTINNPASCMAEIVSRQSVYFLPAFIHPTSISGPSRNLCLKSAGLIYDSKWNAACYEGRHWTKISKHHSRHDHSRRSTVIHDSSQRFMTVHSEIA
ncbi:hypothetical protein C8F04DRAFT_364511 [Mycena alexandri]|uniref:Secreted protein n=1 Tax=Mycena alexandri TaxID=1745969 RepID=A0AAD6S028_9AGAR|nr:hypothetical protein C8F04DRAFT_364511 [Mycena alexandri]